MNFVDLPRLGKRGRVHFREPKRYSSLWVAIGSAVVGAGTSIYSAQQQKKTAQKALDAQTGLAEGLKYEPIDIEKLKREATAAAIENATNSLAIERSLQPNVADTREELSKQINADLKLGGALPADVENRVNTAGRVIGGRSGIGSGSTTPLTASLLGISSLDLINQRRGAASNLLGQNPLPVAGLDPGALASVAIGNATGGNQFNSDMLGVNSKLAESEAKARTAQIGGQVGMVSNLSNLIGQGIEGYYKKNKSTGSPYDTGLSYV